MEETDGTARVLLSREGTGFVRTVGADPGARASGVPLEAVSALRLRVERVELRRARPERESPAGEASSAGERRPASGAAPGHARPAGSSGDGAEWVEVELRRRGPVDLMGLPVAGGIELARGAVPPGAYDRLRLSVSDPTLVLNRDVAVRGAGTLSRGEHALVVPGEAVGIEVVIGTFRVTDRGRARLVLEFLEGHSAATLRPTAGGLLMRPVLTPGSLVRL